MIEIKAIEKKSLKNGKKIPHVALICFTSTKGSNICLIGLTVNFQECTFQVIPIFT